VTGVLFNDYINTGKLRFDIGKIFSLSDVQAAHRALEGSLAI
jgi:NADPH:quinone reductase-like Zn-dependent oxidoreductase